MKRKSQTTQLSGEQSSLFSQIKPHLMKKITLIEKDKIIKADTKTANVLNTFFFTIISNLNIPEYPVSDPIYNDINDPVLKSILKYEDHPSIKAIGKISKLNSLFKLSNVENREILKCIVRSFNKKQKQQKKKQKKIEKKIIS